MRTLGRATQKRKLVAIDRTVVSGTADVVGVHVDQIIVFLETLLYEKEDRSQMEFRLNPEPETNYKGVT